MNTRQTMLLTAVAAFASGFLAGLLFAPETRRRIVRKAQNQSHRLGDHLRAVEEQLQTVSHQFGEKVREATQDAIEQIVPSIPEDEGTWQIEDDELARNLRRMPRK